MLLFVGLATVELSTLRVETRKEQGGHGVPLDKLQSRFPRTQLAVGHAAPLADMTLMFDNSRSSEKAFALVRAQRGNRVLFDCRDPRYSVENELRAIAALFVAASARAEQDSAAVSPDLVLKSGAIYTVDGARTWAQAVAIRAGLAALASDPGVKGVSPGYAIGEPCPPRVAPNRNPVTMKV